GKGRNSRPRTQIRAAPGRSALPQPLLNWEGENNNQGFEGTSCSPKYSSPTVVKLRYESSAQPKPWVFGLSRSTVRLILMHPTCNWPTKQFALAPHRLASLICSPTTLSKPAVNPGPMRCTPAMAFCLKTPILP